jgi:hypothetical protein
LQTVLWQLQAAGYFELKKAEKKLIISHLGYISDTIEIKADENIFNISLVPAFLEMNQIIVKGNFNSYSILKSHHRWVKLKT